jgi:hypothetical protein
MLRVSFPSPQELSTKLILSHLRGRKHADPGTDPAPDRRLLSGRQRAGTDTLSSRVPIRPFEWWWRAQEASMMTSSPMMIIPTHILCADSARIVVMSSEPQ